MAKKTNARPKLEEPPTPSLKSVPEVTVEEARRMLLQQQNARTEACVREVDAVLKKHGCALDVSMIVTTRGVRPNIQVIPRDPGQGS